MATLDLTPEKMVAGGEALARDADGRVVMIEGAIPGEAVRVEITTAKKSFARGRVLEVLDASPDRTAPPCRHVRAGCGGCEWQHITPRGAASAAARHRRRRAARDSARWPTRTRSWPIRWSSPTRTSAPRSACSSARVGRPSGGPARTIRSRSTAVVVAHPLLDDLIRDASFDGVTEAELRCGARTGERLVDRVPDDPVPHAAPGRRHDRRRRARAGLDRDVRRGSGRSPLAHLGDVVLPEPARRRRRAGGGGASRRCPTTPATVVDLYAGVGLFSGVVARAGRQVLAIEGNPAAVKDARHNLAADDVTVTRGDVNRWDAVPADVVIADPSRAGLGADVVDRIVGDRRRAGRARRVRRGLAGA